MVFFFKQKTAYEMLRSLVGSEMCIRDSFAVAHPAYSDLRFPSDRFVCPDSDPADLCSDPGSAGPCSDPDSVGPVAVAAALPVPSDGPVHRPGCILPACFRD